MWFYFVWHCKWRQCSVRRLLLLQYPQYTQPLNLIGEGVLCIFDTGKDCHGVLLIPFNERRPAYFSSHLRWRHKATHIKWRSCSNFFDGLHLDAYNCLCQLTGDLLLSLVSSIQVARLVCFLVGSLAKLLFSFCKRSVLALCRWLMLLFARWSHQRYHLASKVH